MKLWRTRRRSASATTGKTDDSPRRVACLVPGTHETQGRTWRAKAVSALRRLRPVHSPGELMLSRLRPRAEVQSMRRSTHACQPRSADCRTGTRTTETASAGTAGAAGCHCCRAGSVRGAGLHAWQGATDAEYNVREWGVWSTQQREPGETIVVRTKGGREWNETIAGLISGNRAGGLWLYRTERGKEKAAAEAASAVADADECDEDDWVF